MAPQDAEPVLPSDDPWLRASSMSRLGDPDGPVAGLGDPELEAIQRNAPTAAIEMPTPSRLLRKLLATLAIAVVLAAGVGAFVAVVHTAPESPQLDESPLDRYAAPLLDRLEDWGLIRR